jgi:hypothetical protein
MSEIEKAREVADLLAEGVEGLDRPWSAIAQAEVALRLEARLEQAQQPRHTLRWALATSVVLVAAALGLRTIMGPPHMETVSLGAEGTLELSAETSIDLPPATSQLSGRRIVLKSGRVCAEVAHRDLPREGPLVVEAPHLKVVVIGTHFCVSTRGDLSDVSVTQGRVRVETPAGGAMSVGAGESIRSDDGRLLMPLKNAPPLPVSPTLMPALSSAEPHPVTKACAEAAELTERRDCFARLARGQDMAAQNALYGLGLLERDEAHDGVAALNAWQQYETRFPRGVFSPEASLAALGELLQEKRFPEALLETDRYLATDEDGGKGRVQLVRARRRRFHCCSTSSKRPNRPCVKSRSSHWASVRRHWDRRTKR